MSTVQTSGKFSIKENSPTYLILKKLRLEVGENSNIIRKAVFFSAITWLPMFILTLIEGTAVANAKIPFLYDYVTYTRFLVALPILFVAEKFIRFQLSNSIIHFVDSGIISENNIGHFDKVIHKYDRLQGSKAIEVIILILAFLNVIFMGMYFGSYADETTWKYFFDANGRDWTIAGYWFIFISYPIYQFLVFRLIWKFLLWTWFLWKMSRMNLNLRPGDPDKAAGLGFLGLTQLSFGFVGFAQTSSMAAEVANKVVYGGVEPDVFKFSTVISIVILALFYMIPLFFFTRKLLKLRLQAMLDYRRLTHKYSQMFEERWISGIKPISDDELLGTGDIQSLADLGNSFGNVESMRLVPFTFVVPIVMILMVGFPLLPLLTLKFPVSEILGALAGFVF